MDILVDVYIEGFPEGSPVYQITITRQELLNLAIRNARWEKKIHNRVRLDAEVNKILLKEAIETTLDNVSIIDKP